MPAVAMLDQVEGHHGFKHGHFHIRRLPRGVALHKSGHDGHRRDQARGFIRRNGGQKPGYTRLLHHHVHTARHALNDIVIRRATAVGAALGKAMQRGVHQPGVGAAHGIGVQPQRAQFLWAHAVHEHVCRANELQQRGLTIWVLEVNHHAFLVAVHPQKNGRHAFLGRGAGVAGGVTLRGFDLDDFGTQVGQPLACVGAHDHRAGIDDPQACEWQSGCA